LLDIFLSVKCQFYVENISSRKESSDSLEILREGTTEALPSYISLSSVTNAGMGANCSEVPSQ